MTLQRREIVEAALLLATVNAWSVNARLVWGFTAPVHFALIIAGWLMAYPWLLIYQSHRRVRITYRRIVGLP